MYQSVATCFLLLSFRGLDDVSRERCGQVGIRFVQVILENGIVRTMESSLPTARGLAIAGEWIAGGVGTHETALASPDRVDLGGRCVLPGFTDSHVHFPTWAMAQHEVRLEDTGSIDEALSRVRDALVGRRPGTWLQGRGWR